MIHTYRLAVALGDGRNPRALRTLVSRFPPVALNGTGTIASSTDESAMRNLRTAAYAEGLEHEFDVTTTFSREDSTVGELGKLNVGLHAAAGTFRVDLPKDAFDFSTGCARCGLGAKQVQPYMMSERSIKCPTRFGWVGSSFRYLLRAEIGRAIVEATGQPDCMRHPITKAGKQVREWMEPVPQWILPRLGSRSEGVCFGLSMVYGVDEARRRGPSPPCPLCGRNFWHYDPEQPCRLKYNRAAITEAQKFAVVSMFEPFGSYPQFDMAAGTWSHVGGLPLLLYSRYATKALSQFIEPDGGKCGASSIEPVFSE